MKRRFNRKTGIWSQVAEPQPNQVKLKMIPEGYRELQEMAKELGIPANQSKDELIEAINDSFNKK